MIKGKKIIHSFALSVKHTTYEQRGLVALFIVAIIISGLVRIALMRVVTPDYTDFLLPWITHLSSEGISGLGTIQSNYNAPYLILLWLSSFLPFSDLASVKLISIMFDGVLAVSVFLVIRHFKPVGVIKYIGALAILFAPTVLQNGAMWGQCDVIYTSFLVLSFYAYLKNKIKLAWILWGVAFAFKLQAAFFAPFLLFITLHERRGYLGMMYAFCIWAALSAIPIVFGRSISDILGIYLGQTQPIRTDFGLAWFAPTAYQWITSTVNYIPVKNAGVLIGGLVGVGILSLAFLRKHYSQEAVLAIATLTVLAIPFFLPQIHERYLFSSEIFLIITACVIPRFIIPAISMQIITTMAYITYFTQGNQEPPIPFAILSLGVFAIISLLTFFIYKDGRDAITPVNAPLKI